MDVISLNTILKDTLYENLEKEVQQKLIHLAIQYKIEGASISPEEYAQIHLAELAESLGESFELLRLVFLQLVEAIPQNTLDFRILDRIIEMSDEDASINLLSEWFHNTQN